VRLTGTAEELLEESFQGRAVALAQLCLRMSIPGQVPETLTLLPGPHGAECRVKPAHGLGGNPSRSGHAAPMQ